MNPLHRTLCAVLLAAGCAAPERAPDVVVMVLDTTRADRLGVYGHTRPVSPNLDAFAQDSVVYERAWSTASWTLPSHASLLTGKYPTAHGAHITPFTDATSNGDNPAHLREDAITLAELLAERGYRAAAFAGAGWLDPAFGLLQGYEIQDAVNNRTLPAEQISNRAIAWLGSVPREQPVHLLVNYFDPHFPYDPQPPYDRYALGRPDVKVPGLADLIDETPPTPEQLAKMIDLYDGEIEYMDHHIGRLLEALRTAGRYDDSLIVVLSDHGELFGEHGDSGHGAWLWEELIRIPLIVHYPEARDAGLRDQSIVSIVDVLSWIAVELGLELPPDVDGVAVGERELVLAQEFPNALFSERGGGELDRDLVAGVEWPWKLIESTRGERLLYRLDADPRELEDVSHDATSERIRQSVDTTQAQLRVPEPDDPRAMSPEAESHLRELGYIE
ncbi:MAG: sulfatase [Myxococcota bacterium]|nr:sulfatase [Myxococcota bacterium]